MQPHLVGSPLLAIVLLSCPLAGADWSVAIYGRGTHKITVATGSPGEVGLLEALAIAFNRTHDSTVCWRRAGSGESLELLRQKQVDVVLVHAPEAERKAVEQGWGACRTLIGANEFYLVGPRRIPPVSRQQHRSSMPIPVLLGHRRRSCRGATTRGRTRRNCPFGNRRISGREEHGTLSPTISCWRRCGRRTNCRPIS